MLDAIANAVRHSPGIAGKTDIAPVLAALGERSQGIRVGDDCAAIPDGDGWLLFAIEGFVNGFVTQAPYFAGYCGVMVNLSDIAAMGGRPTAVVDAIWSRDHEAARPILAGLAEAARVYNVPVVGGHSNASSEQEQLSVSVLGRANGLLTSFDAQPDDILLAAVDLRGRYRAPWPNWDASTGSDPARLRADLEILPGLAEDGLCAAAKDISMGGVIGTTMMLLECSGVGATVDIGRVPRPAGAAPPRWLTETFPSFGFVLSAPPDRADAVTRRFTERGIACAAIGRCDDTRRLRLRADNEYRDIWDFASRPYIGCGPATVSVGMPEAAHA
ncbi:sll0787 family AIR synthase-like protein [Salinisphaera sp. P385]|uniref:Sll0787 family AIR synthase-like protein n=1 Tax=Spectribacter acetivorans TaxID=3075603 RepID=A0ABU3BAX9_9GAMM|nr:sll0787 family AIR synthase-like protein [Salinisphaera sp. P385]MDT0619626.1 sll0787 family AIR synthase-like protein [Salinisphaera sp. P385]